jgi:hypothetical protein
MIKYFIEINIYMMNYEMNYMGDACAPSTSGASVIRIALIQMVHHPDFSVDHIT